MEQTQTQTPPKKPFNIQRATVRGTFWNYASYFSGKFIVFLSTLVLARLLSPDDYGVAGYAFTIVSFIEIASDLGVSAALIYHREEPKATDTAFWLALGIGAALSFLVWLAGPLAGEFFDNPRATVITQVLGLQFFITAVGDIHNTLLQKQLSFRLKFIPDLAQSIGKAVVTIVLAYLGFGPYSLVVGQLGGFLTADVVLWFVTGWNPRFQFSPRIARAMLTYGSNISIVNIVGIALLNADYLFIGRFLGAAALGTYTFAFRIPELLIKQLCGVIGKVIFPIYAKVRDDANALRRGFLDTMRYVTLVTAPIGLGLIVVARPFTLALFTEKWADSIPVMQVIALYCLSISVTFNSGDIFKAQGRLGLLTMISAGKLVVLAPGLWWAVSLPLGNPMQNIVVVGVVQAVVAILGDVVNLYVVGRVLNVSLRDMLNSLAPSFIGGTIMSLAALATLLALQAASPLIQLLGSVSVGGLTYLGSMWWLQRDLALLGWKKARQFLGRSAA
jgi:O-antigen/teichoic acid export membrane protein